MSCFFCNSFYWKVFMQRVIWYNRWRICTFPKSYIVKLLNFDFIGNSRSTPQYWLSFLLVRQSSLKVFRWCVIYKISIFVRWYFRVKSKKTEAYYIWTPVMHSSLAQCDMVFACARFFAMRHSNMHNTNSRIWLNKVWINKQACQRRNRFFTIIYLQLYVSKSRTVAQWNRIMRSDRLSERLKSWGVACVDKDHIVSEFRNNQCINLLQ